MKLFLLAFFMASALAVPLPLEDEDGGPVELIVNGAAEGEPLELGDILGIHVNEHVDGVVASSTNLLYPLTAAGIVEAAAAAEEAADSVVIPEPVALPPPVAPEVVMPNPVVPEPVVLPEPSLPEVVIPEPVVLPPAVEPEVVIPEPVELPSPSEPEVVLPVIPEPVILPEPPMPEVHPEIDAPVAAAQNPSGEVFNNGVVSVTVSTPQEAGVFATLQSWVNFVLNYFGEDGQTTQKII